MPGRDGEPRRYIWAALLVVMPLVAYLPAIRGGFIWDDDAYVVTNDTLRNAEGLKRIWLSPIDPNSRYPVGAQYYPLVFTSFWVEYHFWGAHPLGYHLTNVLLHALNAILLWLLLRHLSVPGAWLAAAIFALHPVHAESVAWITERKNVLSGAFYLSAMLAYLGFCRLNAVPPAGQGRLTTARRRRFYAVAVGLFLCALLSKTVTCSMPAALLLLIWWKRGRLARRDVTPLVPLFVLGVALGLTTAFMEQHHVGATGKEWAMPFVERCLVAGRALWFYAGKLIWPHPLTFIYPRWQIDAAAGWQYIFPLAVAAAIAALWFYRERIGRAPLVAVLFFAGTLAPALGFFNVYPMRFSFVADHFQYLASIGLIALFAGATTTVLGRLGVWGGRLGAPTGAGLLALLGMLVWQQGYAYKDSEALWRDTLEKNPDAWMAHMNLGRILRGRDKLDDAIKHISKGLELKPDSAEGHTELGEIFVKRREIDKAIPQFLSALEVKPNYTPAYNGLGDALLKVGRIDEAIAAQGKALQLNPDYTEAHRDLAFALARRGRVQEAIRHFKEALRLMPDHAETYDNLGAVLAGQGNFDEGIKYFAEAVRLKPDLASAHNNLGTALARQGRSTEAIKHFREAMRLKPDWVGPHNGLARIFATHEGPNLPDPAKAVEHAERACELTDHQQPFTLETLASAYAAAGRFKEAVATARRALELASASGKERMARRIRSRLQLYEAGKPYRMPRPASVPPNRQ